MTKERSLFSEALRHPRKHLERWLRPSHPSVNGGPGSSQTLQALHGPLVPQRSDLNHAQQAFLGMNFSPMAETSEQDVFLVGYPKSGNTWMTYLVAGIIFGVIESKSSATLVNDLVPDVYTEPFYKRYGTPTYFKSHNKPDPTYRNVVYILRDGRDAMVSYWHFQQRVQKKKIDFLAMVRDGQYLFPCKWHEHVNAWLENPYSARLLVIKYEDLLKQPLVELDKFCAFCGVEYDRTFLEFVVAHASFKELQVMDSRFDLKNAVSIYEGGAKFFRRGIAGSYRDEMPPDVLEAFMSEAGDVLRKQGYSL